MSKLKIAFGQKELSLFVPQENLLGFIGEEKKRGNKTAETVIITKACSAQPVQKTIEKICRDKKEVLLVVPDMTRKASLHVLVPLLLSEFEKKKINLKRVKIIIATGLHQPLEKKEMVPLLGKEVVEKIDTLSHSQKASGFVSLGRTKQKVPVILNKIVKEDKHIICIGVVEPHLYAGYSGGIKSISVGLAHERTINYTHHPGFLDKKGVQLGRIEANPFQNTLWQIAGTVKVELFVNLVNDIAGSLQRIFAGVTRKSYQEAVCFARKIFEKKIRRQADAVICGVGFPKDINVYQASRAFNYLINTRRPIIKKGGMVLVAAELSQEHRLGIGEKRFREILLKMDNPADFLRQIKQGGCLAGEHRAYMVAKALNYARLGFICPRWPLKNNESPFENFKTTDEAMAYLKKEYGQRLKIYVVHSSLSTVAILK